MIEFDAMSDEVEIDNNPRWDETTPVSSPGSGEGRYILLKGNRKFTAGSSFLHPYPLEMKLGIILSPQQYTENPDERQFFQVGKRYHVTIEEVTP